AAAHEALGAVDGPLGVRDGLALRDLPDEHLALIVPRDDGRREAIALLVDDDLGLLAFHDGHDGVGRAQVDSDDLRHVSIPLIRSRALARSSADVGGSRGMSYRGI